MLLIGFAPEDTPVQLARMAQKVVDLRIFPDDKGRFHHSLLEIGGAILLVPQFTLFADTDKGRRPEFFSAMPPAAAQELFLKAPAAFRAAGVQRVESGTFGAHMQVALINDGPVTITLEITAS